MDLVVMGDEINGLLDCWIVGLLDYWKKPLNALMIQHILKYYRKEFR
jgi:hypothetical protein